MRNIKTCLLLALAAFVLSNVLLLLSFADSALAAPDSAISLDGAVIAQAPADPPPEDPASDEPNCEVGGGYTFIICGFINFVVEPITGFQNFITDRLFATDPLSFDSGEPMYKIWSGIRFFATGLLIIAFMFLIFGQTTSMGLDAYTIKKMAPRILMVAIAIQLSYFISAGVVDLTNLLGKGLDSTVSSALSGSIDQGAAGPDERADTLQGAVGAGVGLAAIVALLVSGGVYLGGITLAAFGSILAFTLFVAILIIFGVFFIVALREVFILMCIVLSPVAMVAALLPGTERWFKFWWSNFARLLLMYPFIIMMIQASRIAAYLTIAEDDALNGFLALFIVLSGFLSVFFAFKVGGAALATATGLLSQARKRGTGMALGDAKDPDSMRSRLKDKFRMARGAQAAGERGGKFQQLSTGRGAASVLGKAGRNNRFIGGTALGRKMGGMAATSEGLAMSNFKRQTMVMGKRFEDSGIKYGVAMDGLAVAGGSMSDYDTFAAGYIDEAVTKEQRKKGVLDTSGTVIPGQEADAEAIRQRVSAPLVADFKKGREFVGTEQASSAAIFAKGDTGRLEASDITGHRALFSNPALAEDSVQSALAAARFKRPDVRALADAGIDEKLPPAAAHRMYEAYGNQFMKMDSKQIAESMPKAKENLLHPQSIGHVLTSQGGQEALKTKLGQFSDVSPQMRDNLRRSLVSIRDTHSDPATAAAAAQVLSTEVPTQNVNVHQVGGTEVTDVTPQSTRGSIPVNLQTPPPPSSVPTPSSGYSGSPSGSSGPPSPGTPAVPPPLPAGPAATQPIRIDPSGIGERDLYYQDGAGNLSQVSSQQASALRRIGREIVNSQRQPVEVDLRTTPTPGSAGSPGPSGPAAPPSPAPTPPAAPPRATGGRTFEQTPSGLFTPRPPAPGSTVRPTPPSPTPPPPEVRSEDKEA